MIVLGPTFGQEFSNNQEVFLEERPPGLVSFGRDARSNGGMSGNENLWNKRDFWFRRGWKILFSKPRSRFVFTLYCRYFKCAVIVEMSSRMKIDEGKCPFPNSCIWQTCTVGNSSCYWTANCPMGDTQCEDMIHNANFEVNGDPISCDVCFNT